MPKLTRRATLTYGRTDPKYRKASFLKISSFVPWTRVKNRKTDYKARILFQSKIKSFIDFLHRGLGLIKLKVIKIEVLSRIVLFELKYPPLFFFFLILAPSGALTLRVPH